MKCSCGNFEIDWDKSNTPLIARRCDCDYCTSKKCEYVSEPNSLVKFRVLDNSLHRVVKHGTESAEFHECTNCGLVLVTSEIDGHLYSVLNARVLNIKFGNIEKAAKHFTSEKLSERLARRKASWCRAEFTHNNPLKSDRHKLCSKA